MVIVILSILATLGFVSYQGYQSSTRDSIRLADMSNITKTVELYAFENRYFPTPENINEINFNGAIAWKQWDFWKSENMGDAPTDPLTQLPYLYSITHDGREYQIGWILEWELPFAYLPQAHADVDLAMAYVRGNYNGQTIDLHTGSLDYILWVPSILASDITSVDVIDIISNDKLIVHGFHNLPPSYSSTTFSHDSGVWFTPSISEIVLFQWDIEDLSDPSNVAGRLEFIENLQNLYDGSTIQELESIHNLVVIDTSDSEQVEYLSSVIINENLWGNIETPKQVSIWGGGSSGLTGWRALDPNCDIDDIVIGTQTWAGCNSTLWDWAEWWQLDSDMWTNNYNAVVWTCYDYTDSGNLPCIKWDISMLSSTKANLWYPWENATWDWEVDNIWWKLYTWNNATSGCPTWWHVPNEWEWSTLESYLIANNWSVNIGWIDHSKSYSNATNNLVEALKIPLTGWRYLNEYSWRWAYTSIWSSQDESDPTEAWSMALWVQYNEVYHSNSTKSSYNMAVRCIQDTIE